MTTTVYTIPMDFTDAQRAARVRERCLEREAIKALRDRGVAVEPHTVALEREALWIRSLGR